MRVGEEQVDRGREKGVRKKITVLTLCAMLFALCFSAEAQQVKKVPRVGYLTQGAPSSSDSSLKAFHEGLHELGYVEGQDIIIESRYAESRTERFPDLVADLVRLKVDVI